ncbi:TetR/AcrR family transcriptional regulator [Actinocorallia longicatena]|uniref:TetR/AcrR family transcriptional regulator n=1 Tax=Actinocorallia longicatena TaxID=111803 RepID=A0ABP6QE57_9ACTN
MTPNPGRQAGRPRSAEKREAILAATLALLTAQGYVRTTLDQVAARAGVSKSTVHLRWKTKADLVSAALAAQRVGDHVAPLTGDARADLVTRLAAFATFLDDVRGMRLIGTCLAEEEHHPELLALMRERTVGPRRALFREALEQQPGLAADPEDVVSALIGSYFADYYAGRTTGDRNAWAVRVVDLLLGGALRR